MVFPPGFANRDGDPLPLIVQKGAGGFNYATSDLACVIDRVERLDADLMLYVIGAPQPQHLQMVFAVCRDGRLARATDRGDPRRVRQRARRRPQDAAQPVGESVKFVELLDEAIERADAAIAEKNPDLRRRRVRRWPT